MTPNAVKLKQKRIDCAWWTCSSYVMAVIFDAGQSSVSNFTHLTEQACHSWGQFRRPTALAF